MSHQGEVCFFILEKSGKRIKKIDKTKRFRNPIVGFRKKESLDNLKAYLKTFALNITIRQMTSPLGR